MSSNLQTPLLELKHINKSFLDGSVVAAQDISFTLSKGESLGIVGESGSGKTTISRIIMGLEKQDSGEVLLHGKTIEPGRGYKKRMQRAQLMQMVFQDPYQSLDPRQTPQDALAELVTLHTNVRGAKRAKRVQQLLDQVEIDLEAAQRRPRDLSGGQRQRVAIARALAAEPQLLILDEAVAALDVSIQAQILFLLDEIRRETGVAILFVSHDLEVVRWITDEVLVMFRGIAAESGPTQEVLAQPSHQYTQLLLESVPRIGWDPARVSAARSEFISTTSLIQIPVTG